MAGNAKRVIMIFGGAIVGGLILDNWTGTNALAATGFTGIGNTAATLRSGNPHTTSPAA